MPGSQADETDWENMTNKDLHDKFQQMMSGQVQDVLNRFEEAMEKIDGMEKTFETKLDNKFNELLDVFHNHRRLHLSHLYNNNNHISNAAFQIKWDGHSAFQLRLVKIRVLLSLLLMLLWLLLLRRLRRMTIMRAIMRMRLIKIRTTCSHQHHHHQVDLRYIFVMVGPHHHLRYEMMSIFLN